jgi:hypothetical protein
MRTACALLAGTFMLACTEAYAQDAPDVDVTLIAGGWTHDMILPQADTVAVGAMTLKTHWSPTANLSLDGEAFGIVSSSTAGQRGRINLRKAYVTLNGGRMTVRLGRQVENWGRADKINPTDNLSPRDYTILTSEDADQRLGLTMVRTDVAISDRLTISGNWIPEFRATKLLTPVPQSIGRDRRNWDTGQFAVKLDHAGGGLDWSLSYYRGRDPVLDLAPSPSGLVQRYNRVQVFGGDVAAAAGPFGLRLEAAYTKTVFDSARNPLVRRPELWAVMGVDRTIGGIYSNVQVSARRVFSYKSVIPAGLSVPRQRIDALRYQQDETQYGMTLNLRKSWDDGRWNAEFSGLRYFERQQGLLRLGVRYQITPNMTMQLKAQKFYGTKGSYFDTIRPASSVGLEVRLVV